MKHLKLAIKKLALNINKEDLQILWYENDKGDKFVPDFEEGMPDDVPEGFDVQVSQFPTHLRTTYLKTIDPDEVAACSHPEEDIKKTYGLIDGLEGRECSLCNGTQIKNVGEEWPEEWEAYGSREMMTGESGWSEDLVLAMASSGDFTLSEAIIIAANSCERCMNVLLHDYGCDDGYPEFSDEWKKCGTECEFCKDLGHTRNRPDFLRAKEAQLDENEDPFYRDYFYGACHEYSVALHRLTNLPIMVLIDDELNLPIHSFVKIDDKIGMDAKGKRSFDAIAADFSQEKVEIKEVNEEYIDKIYGIEEDEIETAIEYIEEKGL